MTLILIITVTTYLTMRHASHKLIDTYVRTRCARGELAPSSAEVIVPILRQWSAHVEHVPPRRWTTDAAAEWVLAEHLRANTRKSRLGKLRPYCRHLILEGRLDRDPTIVIGRIRIPDPDPRDLTIEEIGQLIAACPDERARLIVVLMVQLGLRCGDLARIRIEDIDRRRQLLHVRAKGGRGEPTHWEPITGEAWSMLAGWLTGRVTGPLVTSYQRPGSALQPATVSKLVRTWMDDARLKDHPWDGRSGHALRHSTAQHMLDAGADLRDVQYTLGHRSQKSTEIYTRREPVGLRAAMEGRSYLNAA